MKSGRWTGLLFVSPWLAGFLLLTAGPMLYSLYLSFTSASMLSAPVWVGADNYAAIVSEDPLFWISLTNTAYYVGVFVPLSVVLSLALAMLLRARVRGLRVFRTLFFLPSVTNVVAVAVLWLWIFNPDFGLLNSALRVFGIDGPLWMQSEEWAKPALVVMSLWGVGGMTLIFLAALQGVPAELHEAAMLDGAGAARRFFAITLPMISPSILFNTVMSLIGSFQVFTQAFVMTGTVQPGSEGGPNNATLFYVLYLYKKAFQEFRMGYASALAWILFLLTVGLTWALLRLSKSRVHYEAGHGR
ncbi:MAG: sugar ABC transporter permease [Ignavibacteria bacterium]|nr:sugar ABC transporter permease [Ignavibacteria bacterium]